MVSICYKIQELLRRKTSVWRLGKGYSFIALSKNKLSIEKRNQFDKLTEKDFVSTEVAVWCDPAVKTISAAKDQDGDSLSVEHLALTNDILQQTTGKW